MNNDIEIDVPLMVTPSTVGLNVLSNINTQLKLYDIDSSEITACISETSNR